MGGIDKPAPTPDNQPKGEPLQAERPEKSPREKAEVAALNILKEYEGPFQDINNKVDDPNWTREDILREADHLVGEAAAKVNSAISGLGDDTIQFNLNNVFTLCDVEGNEMDYHFLVDNKRSPGSWQQVFVRRIGNFGSDELEEKSIIYTKEEAE